MVFCAEYDSLKTIKGYFSDLVIFGSFGNEPMQSCSVCHVVLSLVSALASAVSVYSSPSANFNHRNFISWKFMYLYP